MCWIFSIAAADRPAMRKEIFDTEFPVGRPGSFQAVGHLLLALAYFTSMH